MRNWFVYLSAAVAIAIGLVIVFGPGLAVMLAAVIIPYVLIVFAVREQHVRVTKACVDQYVALRRSAR